MIRSLILAPILWIGLVVVACTNDATQAERATRDPTRWAEVQAEIRERFPDVATVSVAELAAELDADHDGAADVPLLLDVRAPEEYAVSHLAGARRAATRDEALAVLDGVSREREIVVYCSVGYRSAVLAEALADEGFTRVRNLEGSIFAWANAGHAVERDGRRVDQVHPYDERWGELLERQLWSER